MQDAISLYEVQVSEFLLRLLHVNYINPHYITPLPIALPHSWRHRSQVF